MKLIKNRMQPEIILNHLAITIFLYFGSFDIGSFKVGLAIDPRNCFVFLVNFVLLNEWCLVFFKIKYCKFFFLVDLINLGFREEFERVLFWLILFSSHYF